MQATRVAVVLLGGIVFATGAVFVACGGDDSSPTSPGNDGGTDTTTRPDTGGSPNDAGGPRDARASDPQRVACGSQTCDTDQQICCRRLDGGDSCIGETGPECDGIEVACDERADCTDPANPICCGAVTLSGDFSVECQATCGSAASRQICKSDVECGDGGSCITQRCRGVDISTCGGIPQALCNDETDN
ncbi:hypothetical protein [Pendulispora albinea]|uniref:Tryptophan synthase alpha chain n=1 Tax=Pendulispora albinea TaxID=2741071 RepID=A0ABZ2M5W2_9BACT